MTETPPPAAASGKKRAGTGGGRRGRKGRGGGERGGAASAAPAGPTPPAGDPPPPPASEAAPAVGDGSHGLAGATQSPLAVPGPLPGPGVDPGGSRPASSEPLGAAAAGTRDAPDDAAGVDARDAEAGAGEGPGAAAGAGDPEPPRRPAGPSLQQRLRRFWQTWIWRPAPAVERARRRRLAAGEAGSAGAATAEAAGDARPTLTGTVYLIPISHLDTQWRWTVRETVAQFLPQTVRDNAAAFLAYPSYKVNFDGAFRYRLLAEHHPEAFAEVKRWVAEGRWQVAGATWDALDVNLPGPEAFVRHVLYGRRWFREHLGRDPRDLFLPDCFGFGGHVPVLAAHCGLVGFATSKLRRGDDVRAAFGIPFPLGWWEGVDGSRVLALLEPGGYGEALAVAPGDDPEIEGQIRRHQASLDQGISVRFFGIGDKGGAPGQKSLERLEKAAGETAGVRTETVGSAEILERLAAELPADRLPTYRGELLLSVHGTGCYTSQAALKRWNARNERLAAAAESAAAAAEWLGAAPYPAEQLR